MNLNRKNSYKQLFFLVLFIILFGSGVCYLNKNDPENFIGPEELSRSFICIQKINPQMRGFTYNDSIGLGAFYLDSSELEIDDATKILDNYLEVGDCLQFTSTPRDSVYLIKNNSKDTILFTNLQPKDTWGDKSIWENLKGLFSN